MYLDWDVLMLRVKIIKQKAKLTLICFVLSLQANLEKIVQMENLAIKLSLFLNLWAHLRTEVLCSDVH